MLATVTSLYITVVQMYLLQGPEFLGPGAVVVKSFLVQFHAQACICILMLEARK